MRRAGFLSWLALVSCAHALPTPAPPSAPEPPPARESLAASVPVMPASAPEAASTGLRRTVLRYELNGRKFPLPLVHGSVGGQPVWMLIDTGANSHVIASWVARQLGLPLRPLGDVGSDHTGHAVTAYTVDHPNVTIDEWGALASTTMLVTDVPEPIARIGIGAFVSPQWLAREGEAVVLDLAGGEMHAARWEDAARELDERGGREIAPAGVRLCHDAASAIPGLAFVLQARIDGHPVDLLLDTGAHRTDLLSTSRAGRALAARAKPSREQMYAASGLVRTSVVRSAVVKVGEWSMTTDIDVIPGVSDPACPRDGVVSMDALESCTLILGRKKLRGRCGS